jgi:hypothetical protein
MSPVSNPAFLENRVHLNLALTNDYEEGEYDKQTTELNKMSNFENDKFLFF